MVVWRFVRDFLALSSLFVAVYGWLMVGHAVRW